MGNSLFSSFFHHYRDCIKKFKYLLKKNCFDICFRAWCGDHEASLHVANIVGEILSYLNCIHDMIKSLFLILCVIYCIHTLIINMLFFLFRAPILAIILRPVTPPPPLSNVVVYGFYSRSTLI